MRTYKGEKNGGGADGDLLRGVLEGRISGLDILERRNEKFRWIRGRIRFIAHDRLKEVKLKMDGILNESRSL